MEFYKQRISIISLALLVGLILVNAKIAIFHVIHSTHGLDWSTFLRFDGLMPYQTRALPFLIVELISKSLSITGLDRLYPELLADKGVSLTKLVFMGLDFLSLCLSEYFLYKTIKVPHGVTAGIISVGVFMWQIIFTYLLSTTVNFYYPSDLLAVAFISIFVWAIVTKVRLMWMALLVALGTLNRETMLLAPLIYLMSAPLSKQRLCHTGFLLAAWLLVKSALTVYFHFNGNAGHSLTFCDDDNVFRLIRNTQVLLGIPPQRWLNLLSTFGFLWLLIAGRYKQIRPSEKRLLLVSLLFIGAMMLVGNIPEIRIFGELIPLVTLVVAPIITTEFHRWRGDNESHQTI